MASKVEKQDVLRNCRLLETVNNRRLRRCRQKVACGTQTECPSQQMGTAITTEPSSNIKDNRRALSQMPWEPHPQCAQAAADSLRPQSCCVV
jgi:hypothetical protein